MATYYALRKNSGELLAHKYRLKVELCTAPFTGEAYHQVTIESGTAWKTLTGRYKLDSIGYFYDGYENVHCCYNGREAAELVAAKLGLSLI